MAPVDPTILRRAAGLIDHRGGWVRRHWALDDYEMPCDVHDTHARCFCMIGAIYHLLGRDAEVEPYNLLSIEALGCGLVYYNDNFVVDHSYAAQTLRRLADHAERVAA